MSKQKIKIIAIAKNEGYFIPQFVYHHFFFGFDAIDIYINRTQDNSIDILKKLKSFYKNLNFYDANWVDLIPRKHNEPSRMQSTIYAYAFNNTLKDYDYVIFLDIDEFWMPRKLQSIHDCLNKFNCPDMISFEWLCIDGSNDYIMPILKKAKFSGHTHRLCKSIFKCNLKPEKISIHVQKFINVENCILADGSPLRIDPNIQELIHKDTMRGGVKDFFILHDWMRSPIYFLANMQQGFAETFSNKGNLSQLKATKMPYNNHNNAFLESNLSIRLPDKYFNDFQLLVDRLKLDNLLKEARIFQYLAALNTVRILKLTPTSELAEKVISSLGSLDDIFVKIIDELILLDEKYNEVKDFTYLTHTELLLSKPDELHNNFLKAIKLYPFALDNYGDIYFVKEYFRYICENGDFDKALELYNNKFHNLHNYYWSYLILARAYKKFGLYEKSIEWYKKVYNSPYNEAQIAIGEIKNNILN